MSAEFIRLYLQDPNSPRLLELLDELTNDLDIYYILMDGGFAGVNRVYIIILDLLINSTVRKNLGLKTNIDKRMLYKIFIEYTTFDRFYENYIETGGDNEEYVEYHCAFLEAFSNLTALHDIVKIWEYPFITYGALRNFCKGEICPFYIPICENIFVQYLLSFNKYNEIHIPDRYIAEELLRYLSRWEIIDNKYVLNRGILFDGKRMREILNADYTMEIGNNKVCPLNYFIDKNVHVFYLLLELGADLNKILNLVNAIKDLNIDKLFPILMRNGLRINEITNLERNRELFKQVKTMRNVCERWRKFVHFKNFSKTIETIPFVPKIGTEYKTAKMDFEYRK